MKNIYHIQYIDAFCVYLKKIKNTKPSSHEAYGYVLKNKSDLVIFFIKEARASLVIDNTKRVPEGLIIPIGATIMYNPSKYKSLEKKFLKIQNGYHVAVTWKDVTHIVDEPQYSCPIMYTEGVLYDVKRDHIVLHNPETIRTYPLPIRNHPEKKPTFYVIPKSFIMSIFTI